MEFMEDFNFRNSKMWLKYSHERYLPLEDVQRRLGSRGKNWEKIRQDFQRVRKSQAILFPVESLKKMFWYFEADCIRRKVDTVEQLGLRLYERIHTSHSFQKEFAVNAAVEEAVTSAIYEGANTTRAKGKQLIAEGRKPLTLDEHMIFNNYQAMLFIRKHHEQQASVDTMLKIHELVTRNTLSGNDVNYSGKFRDDGVVVGSHEGIDFKLIEPALKEAIQLTTNNRRYVHPLIRGILLHYFVAYIHPFFDGNGRTARTLFYYKAIRNRLNFVELLSISAHLKEHGRRYEKSFQNAVDHNLDMTYFVDFSLDSLLSALKTVERKVNFLLELGECLKSQRIHEKQISLLQRMSLHKFRRITIEEFAGDISRSHELARLELKKLSESGFLNEEREGRKLFYSVNLAHLKDLVAKAI
jgi:Fic family protein